MFLLTISIINLFPIKAIGSGEIINRMVYNNKTPQYLKINFMEEVKNNESQKTADEKSEDVLVFDSQDIADNKGTAALSYFFILVLIPLLAKPGSKFAQAHARQGLLLCIIEIVAAFLFWIPVLGWLLALAILAAVICGIIQALSGKYSTLPLLGAYAEKIKI